MNRWLDWHQQLGRLGLRLFQLHLLWAVWTVRGGVLLGLFPATAAVFAVLRADVLRGTGAFADDPPRYGPNSAGSIAASWRWPTASDTFSRPAGHSSSWTAGS